MECDIFVDIIAVETRSIIFIYEWTRNANDIEKALSTTEISQHQNRWENQRFNYDFSLHRFMAYVL